MWRIRLTSMKPLPRAVIRWMPLAELKWSFIGVYARGKVPSVGNPTTIRTLLCPHFITKSL